MKADNATPLRIVLKSRPGGDARVYHARDVAVYCGEQRVGGIARVQVDIEPGSLAHIGMEVFATIEVDNSSDEVEAADAATD